MHNTCIALATSSNCTFPAPGKNYPELCTNRAHGNTLFFLPSSSGFSDIIFDIFYSSLPACPSPEMLCSMLTSKLFFHQCPRFPHLSQCLPNDSSESFAWSPKPSLLPPPKLNFLSHSEPLFQLSSPCVTAQTVTHH